MLTVMLTTAERDALRELAAREMRDVTSYVRRWIHNESAKKLGKEIAP